MCDVRKSNCLKEFILSHATKCLILCVRNGGLTCGSMRVLPHGLNTCVWTIASLSMIFGRSLPQVITPVPLNLMPWKTAIPLRWDNFLTYWQVAKLFKCCYCIYYQYYSSWHFSRFWTSHLYVWSRGPSLWLKFYITLHWWQLSHACNLAWAEGRCMYVLLCVLSPSMLG